MRIIIEILRSIISLQNASIDNREWERVLRRLRIGHSKFAQGGLIETRHQPYIEDCPVPLTIKLILVECPTYLNDRLQYFNDRVPNLAQILTNISAQGGSLHQFLNKVTIIHKI